MAKRPNTGVSWSDDSRYNPNKGEVTKKTAWANPQSKVQDKASDYPWKQAYIEASKQSHKNKVSAKKPRTRKRKGVKNG